MTAPTGDITGLISAIGYAEAVAAAHSAHGTNEAFTTALTVAEYGQVIVDAVAAAQHASTDAAAAWAAAAAELRAALTVRDAYMAVPDTGGKHHLVTGDGDARPGPTDDTAADNDGNAEMAESAAHPDVPTDEPRAVAGHVVDETGVREATHADQMAALRAVHNELQAELDAPGPSEQGWPGLLGDERLTPAERKRLVDDRVLAAAAADPTDRYADQVAEEIREQREIAARRARWAAAEAERLPTLDAPAAVDQIVTATTPEEVALIAARLHGHDLHRAVQVLGISSTHLPADVDDQRVRDMLVDELGHKMAIWGGGRGERLWQMKIRQNERALTRQGIDWREPADGR